MKQILQNLGAGETLLAEVPAPRARTAHLLIRTEASLVSLGTEKMLVAFGQANWIDKARQQPEKVKQVLQKIRTDGLFVTVDAVRAKLDQPLPLGYCNAGTVIQVGADVAGFAAGDRVVSNGPHAEIVSVPRNLCARIPDGVPFEHAPFAVAGAIGLQGIRLLQPTLGETFVVTGLGLMGLLAVQLLQAHGCRVIGLDFDAGKCELARRFGASAIALSAGESPLTTVQSLTQGRGVDGVLITASTKSSDPVTQAAHMCRKRGRIVLVGVTGLELNRGDFYEKELSFQVSCSYGPGRYDPTYEEKGIDYPLPYVRWTEQRNFEAVLQQMAAGRLQIEPLISHRVPFARALEAYQTVFDRSALGIVLQYESRPLTPADRTLVITPAAGSAPGEPVIGLLGAGNFTTRTLLPALKALQPAPRLKLIASTAGMSGASAARKFGIEAATTDTDSVWDDPAINTVFITTRHNSHAHLVLQALAAGKHVFVEKPLCLTLNELHEIEEAAARALASLLMVGFNRRFSPHTVRIKNLLETVAAPKAMVFTVNAGDLPANHWTQDPQVGGGRIIGEGCHFIDLLRYLAGAPIVNAEADYLGSPAENAGDVASLHLRFADGSTGTVHYLANGHAGFPKERLEVFCGGRVLQLDNFRTLWGWGWPRFSKFKTNRQDKGHAAEVEAFLTAVREGRSSPIPLNEILEVSRIAIQLAGERAGKPVAIDHT